MCFGVKKSGFTYVTVLVVSLFVSVLATDAVCTDAQTIAGPDSYQTSWAVLAKSYTEVSTQEMATLFMSDVALIDQPKYNITQHSYSVNPFNSAKEDVSYVIESNETKWDAMFTFTNKSLSAYSLRVHEGGEPLFPEVQSVEVFDTAKSFLQKYYNFKENNSPKEDKNLKEMLDRLQAADELKATSSTVDNLRFEIVCEEDYTAFEWINTFNGADYSKVSITFESHCLTFMDNRNEYEVGNTDVNVTQEEAIESALNEIETYSYKLVNGTEIKGFVIREDRITTKLLTRPNGSLLQPYWAVEVGLGKLYPGNIYAIRVNIWAGTPKVIDCYGLGFSGSFPATEENTETPALEENTNKTDSNIIIGTAATTAAVIAIATTILVKKKHKKSGTSPCRSNKPQ